MNFSKRFVNGLKLYGLSLLDLETKWTYFGGNKKKDLALFNILKQKDEDLPEFEPTCICGHKIRSNTYITDGVRILVLGSNCAKKFLGLNKEKFCCECQCKHRNSKDNTCKKCRLKIIKKIGKCELLFN